MVLHLFSTDLKIVSFVGSEVSLVDPNFLDAYLLPSSLAKGFGQLLHPHTCGERSGNKPLAKVDDVLPSDNTINSPTSISISGVCD